MPNKSGGPFSATNTLMRRAASGTVNMKTHAEIHDMLQRGTRASTPGFEQHPDSEVRDIQMALRMAQHEGDHLVDVRLMQHRSVDQLEQFFCRSAREVWGRSESSWKHADAILHLVSTYARAYGESNGLNDKRCTTLLASELA